MGRTELCAWLRANSSGDYRPAAEAADEIEHLAAARDSHFAQAMENGAKANEYRDEADALRKDAERLSWLERQHLEELSMQLVVDAAHDGEYYVCGDSNKPGYGPNLRAAIDAAMAAG